MTSPETQPLNVAIVPVTPFQQNCSIVWETASKQAVIVDPGGEAGKIEKALKDLGVTPVAIWLTHGHIDHAGGAADLAEKLGLPVIGPHQGDAFLLAELPASGLRFGMHGVRPVTPTRWLSEGETVGLGALAFEVLHVPGHTPGHVVFFQKEMGFLLAGDTLFAGSVGRTDMEYGDHDLLIAGITDKLMPLGDDVQFLPGHGPSSTIGAERQGNPFLRR